MTTQKEEFVNAIPDKGRLKKITSEKVIPTGIFPGIGTGTGTIKQNLPMKRSAPSPGYARRSFFFWDENKLLYVSRHPRSLQSLASLETYSNLFSLEKIYSK